MVVSSGERALNGISVRHHGTYFYGRGTIPVLMGLSIDMLLPLKYSHLPTSPTINLRKVLSLLLTCFYLLQSKI